MSNRECNVKADGMMALPSMEKNDSSERGALLFFCLFELNLFIYLRKQRVLILL